MKPNLISLHGCLLLTIKMIRGEPMVWNQYIWTPKELEESVSYWFSSESPL